MRIVHVAMDAAFQRLLGGDGARRAPRARARRARVRSGGGRLPRRRCRREILALDERASAWEETLACEPRPPLSLEGEALDRALAAMGNFADLISPYLAGHSAGVAELAGGGGAALPDRRGRRRRRSGARRSSTTSGGSRSTRGSGRSRGR